MNLVDGDMIYGHRRDIAGYAGALTRFDEQLGEFIANMRDDDMLMITADHGCDPGYTGTDHTREYVPCLIYGKEIKAGVNLHTRKGLQIWRRRLRKLLEVNTGEMGSHSGMK